MSSTEPAIWRSHTKYVDRIFSRTANDDCHILCGASTGNSHSAGMARRGDAHMGLCERNVISTSSDDTIADSRISGHDRSSCIRMAF